MPQPRLAQRQLGGEVGEQELNSLELDDPPPRLAALIDIGDGILERGAGDAERVRGDTRPRLVERGEQQRQAIARPGQQIGARNNTILERESGGRRGAVPHLVLGAQNAETRRALFEDQCRDRSARVVDLTPFPEQQDQVGDVAIGDKDLAAGDRRCRRHQA